MKKVSLLFVCFALACAGADAQSLLERLGERAKNAAENNVGNKVEQGVNDLLNGKLGKKKDKKNQKQETPAQTAAVDGTWTCPTRREHWQLLHRMRDQETCRGNGCSEYSAEEDGPDRLRQERLRPGG